jgi:phytoene synthase
VTASAADHAACAAVLGASGSNFAVPIRLLPPAKRRGTTALYAFCRRADDIVDDAADPEAARVALDAFAAEVDAAVAGRATADPIVRALADTVRRFAVPPECVRDVLDGVRMDLARTTYETVAEVEEYCRRVASAVGLAAIHIWGFTTPAALPAAHHCGLAFQLTNILRDVPEDLARGRIYLAREDFLACGCHPDELRARRIGAGFTALALRVADRAAAHYAGAAPLDRMLSTDGRLVFRAMYGVYARLFTSVRRAGPRIFTERLRPRRAALLAAAGLTLLAGPGRWKRRLR